MILRGALPMLLCAASMAACKGPDPAPAPALAALPLALDPLVDIASGVGLEWLVQVKPRELLGDERLVKALGALASADRLGRFAAYYGGIDVSRASEVIVAGYPDALFAAARVGVDPTRVEAAFSQRAVAVDGRAVDRGVIRMWGSVDGEREQVAIFGREGAAIEHGHLGPLRPAVYFAQGKLRRARPAMESDPLAAVAARVGDAPLRGFAPGPFDASWAAGLGGLLRATAAVAAAAGWTPWRQGLALRVRVVLAGSWGADAPAAGERLDAAFRGIAQDPLGHLLGVDRPLEAPHVSTDPAALELEVTLDAVALARGLSAATGANLHEILGLSAAD